MVADAVSSWKTRMEVSIPSVHLNVSPVAASDVPDFETYESSRKTLMAGPWPLDFFTPLSDEDVEMDTASNHEKGDLENSNEANKPDSKVVVVTNLTRNLVQEHLQTIFGFYGEIVRFNLPLVLWKCTSQMPFPCKCYFGTHAIVPAGQNRGKAVPEYSDAVSARKPSST